MRWLILGGGPHADRLLPLALDRKPDITMTTNAGLAHLAVPTYYWISDPSAIRRFMDEYLVAQRAGTLIVTSRHLQHRGVLDIADVRLDVPVEYPPEKAPFRRGRYVNGRTSGSIMVQFAVNKGATAIDCVAMQGWRPKQKDGIMEWHEPLMRSVMLSNPTIPFTFFGGTVLKIDDVPNASTVP